MLPLVAFVLAGVAGWMIENSLSDERRYSKVFGGRRVPFLPVWGAGGAAVASLAGTGTIHTGIALTPANLDAAAGAAGFGGNAWQFGGASISNQGGV